MSSHFERAAGGASYFASDPARRSNRASQCSRSADLLNLKRSPRDRSAPKPRFAPWFDCLTGELALIMVRRRFLGMSRRCRARKKLEPCSATRPSATPRDTYNRAMSIARQLESPDPSRTIVAAPISRIVPGRPPKRRRSPWSTRGVGRLACEPSFDLAVDGPAALLAASAERLMAEDWSCAVETRPSRFSSTASAPSEHAISVCHRAGKQLLTFFRLISDAARRHTRTRALQLHRSTSSARDSPPTRGQGRGSPAAAAHQRPPHAARPDRRRRDPRRGSARHAAGDEYRP